MPEIEFSNNFGDLSESTGFQFEFYCQACGDAWRNEFQRYAAGTASQFLGGASSLLGGILGGAQGALDTMRDAGYKQARDAAFAEAIKAAEMHFSRCRQCHAHVCAQCFNPNVNLCTNCAPSVEEATNMAERQAEIEAAQLRARATVAGGKQTDGNVVCAECGARVQPSKFCGECGAAMAKKHFCGECGVEIEGGPKFCPDCGAKQ